MRDAHAINSVDRRYIRSYARVARRRRRLASLACWPPKARRADDDVERALAAARVRAAAGDVVAQFSLGAMLYYGDDDTAQAIEWFRKAAAQRLRARGIPDGSGLRLRIRRRAGRPSRRSTGTARPPNTAAPPASERSATSIGRDAASPPTPPKRRAGTAAPPTGDDIRAQYQLGQMYLTARA